MQAIYIDAERADALQTLATLCEQFVRSGYTFEASQIGHQWVIRLTGGF